MNIRMETEDKTIENASVVSVSFYEAETLVSCIFIIPQITEM